MKQLKRLLLLIGLLSLGTTAALAQPLAGSYDVGGGANHYSTIGNAVSALSTHGINAPVTFNVYGGEVNESIIIGQIGGASATNTITFLDASGTAHLNYSGVTVEAVVKLSGADYVTWDGIDITAGGTTQKCLYLTNSSQHNRFYNATLTGNGFTVTTTYGVYMTGADNDDNLYSGLTVSNSNKGFYLTSFSAAGQPAVGVVVENCSISNVRTGIYTTYMKNFIARGNDIQPSNSGNTTDGAFGLYIDTQSAGDTTWIYRNRVHNFVASGSSVGQGLARLRSAGGITYLYNNFCYDFHTVGSAAIKAISNESGHNYCYYNSIRVNEIAGTGFIYLLYMNTGVGTHDFRNNIFVCDDTSNTSYGIYGPQTSYTPDLLDYNNYFGRSPNWHVARFSTTYYSTLADFQAGTAFEDHGLYGDPGFVDSLNLHIRTDEGLVSNAGTPIAGFDVDFDNEARSALTPDIGADEYVFLAPPADFAVIELLGIEDIYSELLTYSVGVRVVNRGSAMQMNVPVRLFYQDEEQDEVLLSLLPSETDTVYLEWTTPLAPDTGVLRAQCYVPGDANPQDDAMSDTVLTVGQPIMGVFEIGGGGNDYESFSAAVLDLHMRGVMGSVTYLVYGGTYNESIQMNAIIGTSATNTITFLELGEPVTLTSNNPLGVVRLNGADYVTFDGIDIVANGLAARAVEITGDADHNTFRNCNLVGAGTTFTSNHVVYILGGGNDYNLFENDSLKNGHYGFRAAGASNLSDIGNEVSNCVVPEAKYAFYMERQNNTRVHHCDIQPGFIGSNTDIFGLWAGAHSSGSQTLFYSNRIHNFRTVAGATGIYTSSGANLRAYNNTIYDFFVTGGTGAIYGIRATGGTNQIYFNSVYIGNTATSGGTNGVNGFFQSGSATNTDLRNNVFQVEEIDANAWGISRLGGTLASDYNCVYSANGGGVFNAARDSVTLYSTLALWAAGTGRDVHSVSGEPGYFSPSDLHIQSTFALLDSAGITISGIATDCDDEARNVFPDIGADEYYFAPYPYDFGVNRFIGLQTTYIANQPVTVQVEVQNYGSADVADVPLTLYFGNLPQASAVVSLPTAGRDTVAFNWTPPDLGYGNGLLKARIFCPGDTALANDTIAAQVTIVGAPMQGVYDLGGGENIFANFNQALGELLIRGVGGEVIFNCYNGVYNESLSIPEIQGTSATRRIIFRGVQPDVVLTAATGNQVLHFNSADYITFEGVDITATGTCNVGVYLENGADYITLRNLDITGRDSLNSGTRGVKMHFMGNDNCLLDNVRITGSSYGLRLEGGAAGDKCDNLIIRNSSVSGANYCLYIDNVARARIYGNNLQPRGHDAVSTYGIYLSSLTIGDSVWIYNNRIHNIRHTYTSSFPLAAGIYSAPGTGAGTIAYIYNNFIYDYTVPDARVYGIYLSAGTSLLYHNSIRINDVGADSLISGIHLGSSLASGVLRNNIVAMEEPTSPCYAIRRENGTIIQSNNNCLYGTGTGFFTGRDGLTQMLTLADWQATSRDLNSVQGDPTFVSATDLHIQPDNTLLSGAGATLPEVAIDIDGQARQSPPDIGADEYGLVNEPGVVADLTAFPLWETGDILLRWSATPNTSSYRILSANTCSFDLQSAELVGTTADTTFTHFGAVNGVSPARFYVVIASTEPPGLIQRTGPTRPRRTE